MTKADDILAFFCVSAFFAGHNRGRNAACLTKASLPSGARLGHQPQDRQGAGCRPATDVCNPRRRGDRVKRVPTILEATGIPAPVMVNGIAQKPIEGVSMTYTWDKANADAPSARTTQYFEMFGNRAIYNSG
jgi:hypothetical protein